MVFLVEWGLVLGSITCALDENPLFLGIVALVEKQYLCSPKEPLYLTILQFTILQFTILQFTILQITILQFTILQITILQLSTLNCEL